MRRLSSLALVLLALAATPTAHARCVAVRVDTPDGPQALMSMRISGSRTALSKIRAAAEAIDLAADFPADPQGLLRVVFDDSITSEQAMTFINRVRSGDLAQDGASTVQIVHAILLPVTVLDGCRSNQESSNNAPSN